VTAHDINIPAHHLDRDVDEILAAIVEAKGLL
jgi:hypothetical protein